MLQRPTTIVYPNSTLQCRGSRILLTGESTVNWPGQPTTLSRTFQSEDCCILSASSKLTDEIEKRLLEKPSIKTTSVVERKIFMRATKKQPKTHMLLQIGLQGKRVTTRSSQWLVTSCLSTMACHRKANEGKKSRRDHVASVSQQTTRRFKDVPSSWPHFVLYHKPSVALSPMTV